MLTIENINTIIKELLETQIELKDTAEISKGKQTTLQNKINVTNQVVQEIDENNVLLRLIEIKENELKLEKEIKEFTNDIQKTFGMDITYIKIALELKPTLIERFSLTSAAWSKRARYKTEEKRFNNKKYEIALKNINKKYLSQKTFLEETKIIIPIAAEIEQFKKTKKLTLFERFSPTRKAKVKREAYKTLPYCKKQALAKLLEEQHLIEIKKAKKDIISFDSFNKEPILSQLGFINEAIYAKKHSIIELQNEKKNFIGNALLKFDEIPNAINDINIWKLVDKVDQSGAYKVNG